jgi:hypothetical protein
MPGYLNIRYNNALTNVDGLSSLTEVGDDLYIFGNDALCQDSVEELIEACTIYGSVYTYDNNGTCP